MLTDAALPPLFQAANATATEAQNRFLRATRIRLLALLAAAVCGMFVWKSGNSPISWAGVLTACSFVLTLLIDGYLYQQKPETTWYTARAAAETAKTLSWRYAVGGEPFPIGQESEPQTARRFLEQLTFIVSSLKDVDIAPSASTGPQITEEMSRARAMGVAERRSLYEVGRIQEQQNWYQQRAAWNTKRANQWNIALLVTEVAGLMFGVLRAAGKIEGDLLGFTVAVAGLMTAWLQTKQHRTLATEYALTALDLATARSKSGYDSSETDWARFVAEAEEVISREQTRWTASRNVATR